MVLICIGENDVAMPVTAARKVYRKTLDVYPGFPGQNDNRKVVIDTIWIQERLKVPFEGFEQQFA